MQHDEPGDIIPEAVAIRRGMEYLKDARGHVCQAHQPHPFLIDILFDRRIISHDHHFYGVQMITMRKVFNNPVGFKIGMLNVKSEDGEPTPPALPIEDTDYLKVLREIRNNHWKELVMMICEEHADPLQAKRLGKVKGSVQMAMDALGEAVTRVWDRKKALRDNEERIKNQCVD